MAHTTMEIKTHILGETQLAEIISEGILIKNAQDSLDLLGDVYYQGFHAILLYEKNITPDFFDLKNGLAGEILQKYSTYRMRLAIVGDFSKYPGQSIRDFMFESNKQGHILFVDSAAEALQKWEK